MTCVQQYWLNPIPNGIPIPNRIPISTSFSPYEPSGRITYNDGTHDFPGALGWTLLNETGASFPLLKATDLDPNSDFAWNLATFTPDGLANHGDSWWTNPDYARVMSVISNPPTGFAVSSFTIELSRFSGGLADDWSCTNDTGSTIIWPVDLNKAQPSVFTNSNRLVFRGPGSQYSGWVVAIGKIVATLVPATSV